MIIEVSLETIFEGGYVGRFFSLHHNWCVTLWMLVVWHWLLMHS